VRVAPAPRAGAVDGQAPHRGAPAPGGDRRAAARCRGGVHRPIVLGAVPRALPRRRHPPCERVLDTTGRIVEDQFNRRGPRASRPADMPLSTSPLDASINPIRAAIGPRAYGLKHRQRTNRMLMLMQLHANHPDDVHAYTQPHPRVPSGRATRAARASTGERSPTREAFPPSADVNHDLTHLREHSQHEVALVNAFAGPSIADSSICLLALGYACEPHRRPRPRTHPL
jgi:hypothetical protein